MKAVTLFITSVVFFLGCNCKKATSMTNYSTTETMETLQELPKLIYDSHTRGFYKLITIENGKISVLTTREGQSISKALSASELDALKRLVSNLDLNKIPTLEAPTEKRFYDGAPITNLEVIKANQSYKTTDFDGGFPPAYIEELVNKILEIADKIE
jgi:L-2-hydroxyglutarate oxidase LhgO